MNENEMNPSAAGIGEAEKLSAANTEGAGMSEEAAGISAAPAEQSVMPGTAGASGIPAEEAGEEPIPEAEASRRKGFPVKLALGIIGVLAVAAAVAAIVTTIIGNKPMALIVNAARKTAKAASANEYMTEYRELLENGSMTANLDVGKILSGLDISLDADASIALFRNAKNKETAFSLSAALSSQQLADVLITASPDKIAVQSPLLLGRNNYGISLKDLSKNLKGSVFDPKKDTYYAMDEELFDYLSGLKQTPAQMLQDLTDRIKAVSADAAKALGGSLNDRMEFTKEKNTISVGDSDIKVKLVTAEADDKALAAIYTDMLDWAADSKALRELITVAAGEYAPLLKFAEFDADTFVQDFYDDLTARREEAKEADFAGKFEGKRVSLTFAVNQTNKQLNQIDIVLKGFTEERISCTLTFGPDAKTMENYSATTRIGTEKYSISGHLDEDSEARFLTSFKIKVNGDLVTSGSFSWDKKTGELNYSMKDILSLTGTMTKKNKETTIVFKSFTLAEGPEINDLGTSLILNGNAKMPAIAKYTDIVTMKESAFEDLADDVKEAVTGIFLNLLGLFI